MFTAIFKQDGKTAFYLTTYEGDGFYIHVVLQSDRGEGVAKVMEVDGFAVCSFQNGVPPFAGAGSQ